MIGRRFRTYRDGSIYASVNTASPSPLPRKPKVACIDYNAGQSIWNTESWQEMAARHDIAIVSIYQSIDKNIRESIVNSVKRRNPDCKVLHYGISSELVPAGGDHANYAIVVDGDAAISAVAKCDQEKWWLYDFTGQTSSPDTRCHGHSGGSSTREVNITQYPPADSSGRRWPVWWGRAQVAANRVAGSSGYFLDNMVYPKNIPGNEDWDHSYPSGGPESYTTVKPELRQGHRNQIDAMKVAHPGCYLMGLIQQDADYAEMAGSAELSLQMHGMFFEKIIGESWSWYNYESIPAMHTKYRYYMDNCLNPKLVVVNGASSDNGVEIFPRYQGMRFVLSFTMMDDGYCCFEHDGDYKSPEWYDEFDQHIGEPIEARQTAGVSGLAVEGGTDLWLRRYQYGAVVMNANKTNARTVDIGVLGSGYRRFAGSQDPAYNNGGACTSNFTINGTDGILLLRD